MLREYIDTSAREGKIKDSETKGTGRTQEKHLLVAMYTVKCTNWQMYKLANGVAVTHVFTRRTGHKCRIGRRDDEAVCVDPLVIGVVFFIK